MSIEPLLVVVSWKLGPPFAPEAPVMFIDGPLINTLPPAGAFAIRLTGDGLPVTLDMTSGCVGPTPMPN